MKLSRTTLMRPHALAFAVVGLGLALLPAVTSAHEHPSHYSVTPQMTVIQNPDTMAYVEATGIPGADYTLQAAPDFGSWSDDAYPVEFEPGHFAFYNEAPSEIKNYYFRVGAERPNQNQLNNQLPRNNFNPQLQQVVDLIREAAEAASSGDQGVAMKLIAQARELYEQLARQGAVPGPFNDFARVILLNLLAQTVDARNQANAKKVWKSLCVRLIYLGKGGLGAKEQQKAKDNLTAGGAFWRGACVTFKVEDEVHVIDPSTLKLTGPGFMAGDTLSSFFNGNGYLNLQAAGPKQKCADGSFADKLPNDDKVIDGTGEIRKTTLSDFWKALKAALAAHPAVKNSKCLNILLHDGLFTTNGSVPGYADTPGRFSMLSAGAGPKVYAHELGHLLGIPHHGNGIMHPKAEGSAVTPGDNDNAKKGVGKVERAGAAVEDVDTPVPTPEERAQGTLPAEFKRLKRLAGSIKDAKSFARWQSEKAAFLIKSEEWAWNSSVKNSDKVHEGRMMQLAECEMKIADRLKNQ